ncbi:MAG: SusC/RagA family TonB-linked outer membrane protein, partial [Tannerellaceae bacterium]|nr:SusC/RagA family TonB-linked outer membrane protein [Tannerellaceae bacterium]
MKKTDLFSFERTLLVKLILLFLLCNHSGMKTHAEAYAETVNLTIRSQNLSLKDILSYIEENSEFIFVYHGQNIDLNKTVDIHLTDQPISTILENLFSQTDTEYIIRDRQIILRKKAEEKTISVPVITQPATIQVRGTVFDDTGEPVIGANVVEKGTTNGTITNLDGEFTLTVHPNAVLVITYIGFEEQQIQVNNRQLFTIRLQQDLKSLDEVVVVGYGVQRKVNMTGSVATISSDAIESRPLTNVSTALAGLAAGVRVNQTSARPGDDSATIRVRGQGALNSDNSGALVVIDGIPGTLDAVNPNDIESISILKDAASSAIYGTRAANGVILVTTKKGTSGKPKVTFTGTLSLAQPTRLPEFISDYATYMELVNEGYLNGGSTAKYTDTDIQTWREAAKNPNGLTEYGFPNYVAYPNTDWASAVFENNWIQNYNLSVTGGSEESKYAISAGYLNNPGIISNTGIEKFQTRINLETKMGKFLTVGTHTFMSLQKNGLKSTSSSMLAYIQQNVPGQYPYQYDGYWAAPSSDKESTQTGSSLTHQWHNTGGKSEDTRVNTTLFARIDIWKGLSFETKVNYQLYQKESNTYPINQKRKNFATNLEIDVSNAPSEMTTTYNFKKEYTLTYDNVLTYQFDLNKQHNFAFLLGHNEYYWNDRYDFSASKKGLIAEGIYVPSAAGEEETKFAGKERDRAMRSYFGRVNYDYKGKYLFEFNIRRDASSRFGNEMRWGNFPSISGGWRLSEEAFLTPVKEHFQNLKIRASWGRLGSDNAGNYDYQSLYGIYYYGFNDSPLTALAQKKMANQLLHWEETEVIDIAIEGTSFSGRLNFEFDFYNKYTKGILTTPDIYLTAGDIKGPTQNT